MVIASNLTGVVVLGTTGRRVSFSVALRRSELLLSDGVSKEHLGGRQAPAALV